MSNKFKHSIHIELIKRLVLVTAVLSVIAVLIAYYVERNRILEDISYYASQQVAQLNPQVYDLLEDPDNLNGSAILNRIDADRTTYQRSGHFPAIALFNLQGGKIAERIDPDYADTKLMSERLALTKTDERKDGALTMTPDKIDGHSVVRIEAPMVDLDGTPVLHIAGIYVISETVRGEFNQRLLRTLLFVFLVVISCSLVVYQVVLGLIRRVETLSLDLINANMATIQTLGSAIAKRDSDTDAHNYRVTIYSLRLAEAVGAETQTIQGIIKGAFLHDVGKIGIEDKVLLKPGKLDDDEFSIMRRHVEHGVDIVKRADWLEDAVPIVSCHHEKYDGTGYPNHLAGEEIPLGARIFAIADVFDALTSVRPYKKAFSMEKSLEILLEGRGTHFDPVLLEKFIEIAPDLYHQFAGDETGRVRVEVASIVKTYYPKDVVST